MMDALALVLFFVVAPVLYLLRDRPRHSWPEVWQRQTWRGVFIAGTILAMLLVRLGYEGLIGGVWISLALATVVLLVYASLRFLLEGLRPT